MERIVTDFTDNTGWIYNGISFTVYFVSVETFDIVWLTGLYHQNHFLLVINGVPYVIEAKMSLVYLCQRYYFYIKFKRS